METTIGSPSIPWQVIAVSKDDMATELSSGDDPFAWKPSLVMSAYQPKLADLPEDVKARGERVTYVKITCSISGYNLSKTELDDIDKAIRTPTHNRERVGIITEYLKNAYLGCYGVLLKVSALPYIVDKKTKIVHPINIDFRAMPEDIEIKSKAEINDVQFTQVNPPKNMTIKKEAETGFLFMGDGYKIQMALPTSHKIERVTARVLSIKSTGHLMMQALKKNVVVGTTKSPVIAKSPYLLEISYPAGIDKIEFTSSSTFFGGITEFTYFWSEEKTIEAKDYPHITDFEPKKRDLYESGTLEGEILSGSKNDIKIDESYTHSTSTETGWNIEVTGQYGDKDRNNVSGKIGYEDKTKTESKTEVTMSDEASRTTEEKVSTKTQIEQMYNILAGYHAGTNRAVFLMLPRPHTLQPSDARTLIKGLRVIEGIQEFFLVITSRADLESLCLQASLETVHVPEPETKAQYDLSYEDFEVQHWAFEPPIEQTAFATTYVVREGYLIDCDAKADDADKRGIQYSQYPAVTYPEPFHRGMALLAAEIYREKVGDENTIAEKTKMPRDIAIFHDGFEFFTHLYRAENATTAKVEGMIRTVGGGSKGGFVGKYRIFTRSEKPKSDPVYMHFLKAREIVSCRFKNENEILKVAPLEIEAEHSIIDESFIQLDPAAYTMANSLDQRQFASDVGRSDRTTFMMANKDRAFTSDVGFNLKSEFAGDEALDPRLPAVKELLSKIQRFLSRRSPYETYKLSIIDTNYFAVQFLNQTAKYLPDFKLSIPLGKKSGIPKSVLKALGKRRTIEEVLKMKIDTFSHQTGLSIGNSIKLRRKLLGLD